MLNRAPVFMTNETRWDERRDAAEQFEPLSRPQTRTLGSGCLSMITFAGDTISIDDRPMRLAYPVRDAFRLGDRIIVLYDPNANTSGFGQFPNLIALGLDGRKLWTAELPTSESGDSYSEIVSREPLIAYSWKSYSAEIDVGSGKIKARTFLK